MNLHVAAQISSVVEVLAADGAGGGELPGAAVDGHVVLEVPQLGERLAAFAAGISRIGRVPPHVHRQVITTSKNLRTLHSVKYNLVLFTNYLGGGG